MKRLSTRATFLLLAFALGDLIGQDVDFERGRSPYAVPPPFAQTRRPGLEELARAAEAVPGDQPSTRRPTVESLLDELSEARDALNRQLSQSDSFDRARNLSASPTVERIESLLTDSQARRIEHAEKTRRMLQRLDVMLHVRSNYESGRDSEPNGGESISQAEPRDVAVQPAEDQAPKGMPADLTGDAVDRLRLADALFGRGDFELARDLYLQLRDSPSHATQRIWIEFQIASCYRNLGDIPNAEKFYRTVVGSKEETEFANFARWWLDAIQKKKHTESVLEMINFVTKEGQDHGTDKPGR